MTYEVFRAIGNPERYRMMAILSAPGNPEISVKAMAYRIKMSHSQCSQMLSILRDAGWVQARREAQTVYYRKTPGMIFPPICV